MTGCIRIQRMYSSIFKILNETSPILLLSVLFGKQLRTECECEKLAKVYHFMFLFGLIAVAYKFLRDSEPYRTEPYRTEPYRTVPYRTVPYRTEP